MSHLGEIRNDKNSPIHTYDDSYCRSLLPGAQTSEGAPEKQQDGCDNPDFYKLWSCLAQVGTSLKRRYVKKSGCAALVLDVCNGVVVLMRLSPMARMVAILSALSVFAFSILVLCDAAKIALMIIKFWIHVHVHMFVISVKLAVLLIEPVYLVVVLIVNGIVELSGRATYGMSGALYVGTSVFVVFSSVTFTTVIFYVVLKYMNHPTGMLEQQQHDKKKNKRKEERSNSINSSKTHDHVCSCEKHTSKSSVKKTRDPSPPPSTRTEPVPTSSLLLDQGQVQIRVDETGEAWLIDPHGPIRKRRLRDVLQQSTPYGRTSSNSTYSINQNSFAGDI